ncbi:hypothetical protein EJB05_42403, partial [Eragrostis curvula]
MEQDGGAAKCSEHSSSDDDVVDEDRLSALPMMSSSSSCSTSTPRMLILSRRWRHIWTLLPELKFRFDVAPEPYRFRDALATSDVPLHNLFAEYKDANPESFSVWLPAAARRLSGNLTLHNSAIRRNANDEEEAAQGGTIELPCLEKATIILLHLGLLSLAMPPAGVFTRLAHLTLNGVRFHGPCELRDAVSSARCPLIKLFGLRQLTIVAQALTELAVANCFAHAPPSEWSANISAPQLQLLEWKDPYDEFVQFGDMAHLRRLSDFMFFRFKAIESLMITLLYMPEIGGYQYLMDDMTVLPNFTFLDLVVIANGHSFGASSFHVLKMCTSIRRMALSFSYPTYYEAPTACSSGCICDQSANWKTEELLLNRLQELEIEEFRGCEHEFAFMKRLFGWATVLNQVTVNFSHQITGSESKIKEFFQMFQSFSRPGIYMKFLLR